VAGMLLAPSPLLEHYPFGYIQMGFSVAPSAASMDWVLFAVPDLAFGSFWASVPCVFLYLLHGLFVSDFALLDIVFPPWVGFLRTGCCVGYFFVTYPVHLSILSVVLCTRARSLGTLIPLWLFDCYELGTMGFAAVFFPGHGCLFPLDFPDVPPYWWVIPLVTSHLHHLSFLSQFLNPRLRCALLALTGCLQVLIAISETLSRFLFCFL